ncbi:hypothetical protein D3C85_754630 [compost metagenome]
MPFKQAVRRCQRGALAGQVAVGGVQAVCDDLLHRHLDMEVEKTIPQPHFQGGFPIVRNQVRLAGMEPVQIFNDHTRLRHVLLPGVIAKHRELADRPQRLKFGPVGVVAQVDNPFFKLDVQFIEGDQCFVAERRERVEIKSQ